ncbi:MAG: glycosyl hydrolase family 65 protein, partial [Bacteroidota bacterium]|nr:glycosyl hydrolase family 65 protein [Bacteroidota bacterium]
NLLVLFVLTLFIFCENQTKLKLIDENFVGQYIDKFNNKDVELYQQFISNAEAKTFILDNVPLIDIPDKDIEETYYFRWWTYRKHIKNTKDGFVITEFLPEVYWSKKHNTINCPAAHHIYEGRWLRDTKYVSDYIDFWLKKSEDGIRQYSFWVADATLSFHKINRNDSLIRDQLPFLLKNYEMWEAERRDKNNTLFWQYDTADGMEHTASGRILNNGVDAFTVTATRPTINSYMYGDAMAIAQMAHLVDKPSVLASFSEKANRIKKSVQDRLWNKDLNFFTVLPKNYVETDSPLNIRELIGYVPWYFNLPDDKIEYATAWQKIKDTLGFAAPRGLTVTERSHPYFQISYKGHECQWNGPSWPFATTQTLKALANHINNYTNHQMVSKKDYYELLLQYAKSHKRTNHKGETLNWIDENLNPFTGDWISRTRLKTWDNGTWSSERGGVERGKDYNHSGFCDLVISDLLGLKPQIDGSIKLKPMVPESWDWFCIDRVVSNGREIRVIWDKDGEKYKLGKGFMIFINDKLVKKSATLKDITIDSV